MLKKRTCFGLDFGTTNSALSLNIDGKVSVIDIDAYNLAGKTMRSVMYFDEEKNIYVGHEAIGRYIDNGAAGRFLQSIKAFLPSTLFGHTLINGKTYELEQLIAIFLRRVKRKGEDYVGKEVTEVVMGRPVFFSSDQEKDKLAENRLRKAAHLAGFKNIVFQFEPVAAALTFESTLPKGEEKIVFIGDFGGGTSDFTIIKLRGGSAEELDRSKDVLSLGGLYIAGDVFDADLMWERVAKYFGKDIKYKSMTGQLLDMPSMITFKLKNWHLIPQLKVNKDREFIRQLKTTADNISAIENLENLIDDNYGFMLFQAIEKAKIDLSSFDSSYIIFNDRKLNIKEMIYRNEYERIIQSHVHKIKKCMDETLNNAGLSSKDIDVIFTTGGTSYIPCIRRLFVDKFGAEKMTQMDAFTSVAYGLGVSCSSLFA
jgi:hypothetical chaperone protein